MSMETKIAGDAVRGVTRTAETLARKAWSILDAASEKPRPSQYLSEAGQKAMQGVRQ